MKNIISKFVEIHTKYKDTFEVGEVVVDDKNFIIIKAVDSEGEYDGYSFNEKKEISKIKYNGKYLEFIKSLQTPNNTNIDFTTKEKIILYAIKNSKPLYVASSSWSFYKQIKPLFIQENKLIYYPINYCGNILCKKSISIDLLFHVEVDTKRLRTLERYFDSKNTFFNTKLTKLSEVYDNSLDTFDVGEIQVSNQEYIIMKCYNGYGEYDGFKYQDRKHITQIKSNTNYLKFLRNVLLENDENFYFNDKESILEFAFKNRRFVSVSYGKCKYYYNIKINSFNKKVITYQAITQTGQLDKETSIEINKINYLIIDSLELKAFERVLLQSQL